MKVCLFTDARSVHVQRIVPGLVARGVTVHVVTHKPAVLPGATVERFRVPGPSLRYPYRWTRRWQRYLRSFFQSFDLVHVHFLADWGFARDMFDSGCLVVTPWGSDIVPPPGEGEPSSALTAARIEMLRGAALVTAWGPTFARMIADFGGIEVPDIRLLPLGVDLSLFRPNPTGHHARHGYYQVGYIKGFRPVYGPICLVRAMPFVLDSEPGARFLMVGDGPQLESCKTLAAQLQVEHAVRWVRRQVHDNVPNYLSLCDVTAIPSLCESFGAAALESSAMQVPVVASDVGGLPDVVRRDETGLLVPPRAPAHLAEAIIRLLEDDAARVRMGEAGRRMVRHEFEWGGILDKWVETYAEARESVCACV